MRGLFSFILTSTVGLAAGCTGGLWGPFAHDTESNCNVTPSVCATGQSCNAVTGLCEGGSQVDMSSPPMTQPIFGAVRLATTLPLSYFNMGIGDLTQGDKLDIVLSADTEELKILPGDKNFVPSEAESLMLPAGQKTTYAVNYDLEGTPTVVVASTASKLSFLTKKNGAISRSEIESSLGNGYLILDVGYANEDDVPDLVVTSSKLALATQVLMNTMIGTGEASVFFGMPGATSPPPAIKLGRNDLCFAGASRRRSSGAGMALSKPGDMSTTLVQFTGSTMNGQGNTQSPMPAHDFSIPADLDGDGDLDLVLVKTFEVPGPGMFNIGNVHYLINTGTEKVPAFAPAVKLNNSYLIGAQVDDLDGDGLADIVVAEYGEKKFSVYHNVSTAKAPQFSTPYVLSGTYGARVAYFKDMDGDGCKDLVALFGGDDSSLPTSKGSELKLVRGLLKANGTCN